MQLYYLRHGQSENNALWSHTGSNKGRSEDPPLTEIGLKQAWRLAEFLAERPSAASDGRDPQNLAGFGITHLYCSLMIRSVETGTAIAEALGLPLVAWLDLHETGGIFVEDEGTGEPVGLSGRNRAFFEEHYPQLVLPEEVRQGGWWNRPFEDRSQRPSRARRVYRDLVERHGTTDDRVALVSHGGFYNYLMTAILGLPSVDDQWFAMNNCAITRIDLTDEWTVVAYTNRTDFLPDEWIT
jgi:2,3-bisphosphoglycerate-dependent phosphoglycerate mutase